MERRSLLLAISALVVLALAWRLIPSAEAPLVTASIPDASPNAAAPAPGDTPAQEPSANNTLHYPDSIRNVTPQGILPHPPVSGPLKRVAPPPRPVPEAPPVPEYVEFRAPLVLDARTIKVKNLTIRLAGLAGPGLEEECTSRLGDKWPCGMRARTALRALIKRYAVRCDDIVETGANEAVAHCRKGTADLGLWMLQQGWARAAGDAMEGYKEAQVEAERSYRGLWRIDGIPSVTETLATSRLPEPDIPLGAIEIAPEAQQAPEAEIGPDAGLQPLNGLEPANPQQ